MFYKLYPNYIKEQDLLDESLYLIVARNASVGIWNKNNHSFTIARNKFGFYLFEEYHYDYDTSFGTAKPLELLLNSKDIIKDNILEFLNIYYDSNKDIIDSKIEGYRVFR